MSPEEFDEVSRIVGSVEFDSMVSTPRGQGQGLVEQVLSGAARAPAAAPLGHRESEGVWGRVSEGVFSISPATPEPAVLTQAPPSPGCFIPGALHLPETK